MSENSINSIAIVGGGLSGWTAALTLAKLLQGMNLKITLVEASQPTNELPWLLPTSINFHQQLGIDEKLLLKNSLGTFSLGTHYHDWSKPGHNYFQPHGPHGSVINFLDFHHLIIKARAKGVMQNYDQFAFATSAAKAGKFMHPQSEQQSLLSVLHYSHNINPEAYLNFIKSLALKQGVNIVSSSLKEVTLVSDANKIDSILLENGEKLVSDFYLDVTGSNALLLNQLQTKEFVSWQEFMPFDSKLVVTRNVNLKTTKPLNNLYQTEFGYIRNFSTQTTEFIEYIFDSGKLQTEDALDYLITKFEGSVQFGPLSKIISGQQKRHWIGNCLAIGSSAVDFCPLELSVLQTVQESTHLFIELFPDLESLEEVSAEYNRIVSRRMDNMRDYISLHFTALTTDSNLPLAIEATSETLNAKIALFKCSGKISFQEGEIFNHSFWTSTFLGLDFWPDSYDQFLDAFDFNELSENYDRMMAAIKQTTEQLPNHIDYLKSGLN